MAQESWNRDKEETGCKVPEGLILCANNCGLFGSPATMNLCSKCYRDLMLQKPSFDKQQQISPADAAVLRSEIPASAFVEEKAGPSAFSAPVSAEKAPETIKTSMNRCSSCRKKVGLTGFRCRCGHMFCGVHRYSDRHGCTYDYKAAAREAISKANPVVKAEKVVRF